MLFQRGARVLERKLPPLKRGIRGGFECGFNPRHGWSF
jgi:hypothetical protein